MLYPMYQPRIPKSSQTWWESRIRLPRPRIEESRFLRPDVKRKGANSKKIKQAGGLLRFPEEKPVLRPFFEKPKPSGIAEFYLNPPRHIAVREGVRTVVKGKFIYVGDEKFYIRGVTYGPFRPDDQGCQYHDPGTVDRDFAQMAANGINAVRTYTVPPRWLLDIALKHNLRVMIGLPWEEHITFLDDKKLAKDIERRVREGVKACAGHAAVLCFTIGNEIPSSIVRWHGRRRIQSFLERLYKAVKEVDPEALVTYVNFPTTEYLELPFIDFVSFNVYLETREKLEGYLARLQNLAGEKPLVMAEIGLDSMRNGQDAQASTLEWQIRSTFATGCSGIFVFSWTDEWHRGGFDIEDWGFGLTDRNRNPKPSLASVSKAYAQVPFPADLNWPSISVVVCTYNGNRTIRDCLEGLRKVDYPNFEVIVVNDGSTDGTEIIAKEYGFRVISIPNGGLSNARNVGMRAAKGEIVAYIDDDAVPDPQWLTYLAATFLSTDHVGVGGPNIPPADDGPIAECVANSPGGPIHVLLTDQQAEHIPGCNMAFRKAALEAIGGFDPQFRIAGDDVDLCWRILKRGWTLGFNPAAMVWHHRRNSVKSYWKQQLNYGKAEGYLERKWPEKYNAAGHVPWAGRIYFKGFEQLLGCFRGRIYQGTWGSALFQSIYQPAPSLLWSLPLMPEWIVIVAVLGFFSLLGLEWHSPSAGASSFPFGRLPAGGTCGIVRLQAAFPPLPGSTAAQAKGAYRFSPSDAANGAPDRQDQTRFDPLAQMRRRFRHSASSAVAQDFHDLEPTVALADCLARIGRGRGKSPADSQYCEAATLTAGTWNCAEVCSVRFVCLWRSKSTAAEISSSV